MPDSPISIIDFHGFNDTTIPASPDVEGVLGPGPDNTTQTHDGYYYHIKAHHLARVRAAMNCEEDSAIYPTHMDGEEGWACEVWTGCDQGAEVVHCTGSFASRFPWGGAVDGYQIIWDFMKSHSRGTAMRN